MSILKSLAIAIELALGKRDHCVKVWQQLKRAQQMAQAQKDQLAVYASETELKWTMAALRGTTPEMMVHHYQFMDRLHHAIGLQQEVVAGADRRLDAARRLVLDAEVRLAGLNRLLDKRKQELALDRGRSEQKQMDEFAAMQSRRVGRLYLEGQDHEHR